MIRIVKRLLPLENEGNINRLKTENEMLRQENEHNQAALVELAEMLAAQDDALVELAGIIAGE